LAELDSSDEEAAPPGGYANGYHKAKSSDSSNDNPYSYNGRDD